MAVLLGHARGDENGGIYNGKAGDQTGKEVCRSNWYLNSKGWRVFRPKSADVARKLVYAMEAACDNDHIGYDQYQRLSLYEAAEPYGFDCAKVTTNCETDCSALVRVCAAYAGIMLSNFNTQSEPSVLAKSGAFDELTDARYTEKSEYLMAGDILVTRTQGHTAIVLTNGSRADEDDGTLRRGDKGEDVRQLQKKLLQHGYSVGPDGADGDFGKNTEAAVKAYQRANNLNVDGIVGPATWASLLQEPPKYTVTISGITKGEADELASRWPNAEVTQDE